MNKYKFPRLFSPPLKKPQKSTNPAAYVAFSTSAHNVPASRPTLTAARRSFTLCPSNQHRLTITISIFTNMDSFQTKTVVNLSDHNLTDSQMKILSKGLKFCPTPCSPDPGEQREDLDNLHRRVRQLAYYESEMDNEEAPIYDPDPDKLYSLNTFKHRKFKLRSTGRGPPAPNTVESMIKCNETDFVKRHTFNPHHKNVSPKELEAITQLQGNKQIIIKPADKGGAIVILNRTDYLREGYKQLSNTEFYLPVPDDLTESHRRTVQNKIEDMYQDGDIDETVKDYLTDKHCTTPNFYLLPKIHKGTIPPPGRPILSANGSPTEKISQFVDHFINPFCPQIKSFVKDSTHFLQILGKLGQLPADCLLVTMDVNSLYTNIPTEKGIEVVKNLLNNKRNNLNYKPSNHNLIELLTLVLTKNNFQFNGQHFLQIKGVSMGSKVSPSFAILYMDYFESTHVYTYQLQPTVYLRYIDDIFMIWPHGNTELATFVEFLNTREPNIKFSTESSDKTVNFLDIQVSIRNRQIHTDLYTKPTDSHDYLLYSSAHPQKCKDSIPYSQFLRIRRICSDIIDFETNCMMLSSHFHRRGYPPSLIEKAALTVFRLDRNRLLNQEPKDKKQKPAVTNEVFLTTTFNPNDDCLREITRENWDILGTSSTTTYIHQKKLMTGYRRPKNLRDLLVKAKIPYMEGDEKSNPQHVPAPERNEVQTPTSTSKTTIQTTLDKFLSTATNTVTPNTNPTTQTPKSTYLGTLPKDRGFTFCNKIGCKYCKLLDKTGTITSHITDKHYTCMKKISCRSSNLIYCLSCKNCGKQYVGQTLRRLKDRLYEHLRDIDNLNTEKPLGAHFAKSCKTNPEIKVYVLEFIKKPPRSPEALTIRNRVEKRWIHLLRTPCPFGLNLED